MPTIDFIHDLERYIDTKVSETDAVPEIKCSICQRRKLTTPKLCKALIVSKEDSTESGEPLDRLINLHTHGYERTLVFPCGHCFGDRCIRDLYLDRRDLTCPSCGFRMAYPHCGHAIAPAIVPVCGTPGRDAIPFTIPEGGKTPSQCKECRWGAIQTALRFVLNSQCVVCAQRTRAGIRSTDDNEHDEHRRRHIGEGIKETLSQIMMLVQPDFITRDTEGVGSKNRRERDRRDAEAAILYAIVLTDLEDSIWRRTATRKLTTEQARRHATGVHVIESHILGLLMDYEKKCRRMW